MKQKKRRVKLFNPLTEIIEKVISKVKYGLTSCPLPSDIEDLSQTIFNSLLDSVPKIDPDINFNEEQPINIQLTEKMTKEDENEINFDNFWAEWLKFRASIWSLSSISVVDDIYESYIKERLEELKIIIENVESKEQIATPTIKYEFNQVRNLVEKAYSNLQSMLIDPITYTDDFEEEDYNAIDQQKEQKRIKDLMSHRTQIRRIKDDFSTRYKNFFKLSNQERSIADVQHRRCISIIEEMLIALNKLSKQQDNFSSLKRELYLSEQILTKKIVPLSENIQVSPIYKDKEKVFFLPEDEESVNAESLISNLISSRSNSPFNSPLSSPNKPSNIKNDEFSNKMITPIKKQERAWKTPEPQAPPAVIQPLSLHEFSGMPDSFKDLSRRFNTSDSDYISASSSPDSKLKLKQQQQRRSQIQGIQKKSPSSKTKTVVFNKDQIQSSSFNRREKPINSILKHPEIEPKKQIENEIEYNDREESPSISSYTSDDEDPATVSRNSKIEAIFSPIEEKDEKDEKDEIEKENVNENKNKNKEKNSDKSKKRKNSDPVLHHHQQRTNKQSSASDLFDSSFLKPKRKISDYDISVSSSIFNSASKLNLSLDNISIKSSKKDQNQQNQQKQRSSKNKQKNSQEENPVSSFSSSAPLSPIYSSFAKNENSAATSTVATVSPSRSSPILNRNQIFESPPENQKMEDFDDENDDDRDELTRLKDDYETLLVQLNVYSEENKELQTANEEIPYYKKKIDFYEDLEAFYDDEIQRLRQTINSLSKRITKKSKDESIYLENSRLHREKDLLFAKLQNVQKELSAVTSKNRSSNELLLMLKEEKEKNEKLKQRINELEKSKKEKKKNEINIDDVEFEERRKKFENETEMVKQQIKMQNLNLKILHLKSKIKRYKIRFSHNETSQSKESKEIEKLENEIAAIRNSFESIQDLRFNQQDELCKEKTKNDFLQSTIKKLNEKIQNPKFDIESEVMNELKEKIQENRNLKDENDKVKSTLFELYHLICGEALTDDVEDVTILLDGIRQHLT